MYLVLHKELEEYRAVKKVGKSSVRYETFRKEALLLKELRHPGLPMIYDIEEDEEYSYLVEEYLQGDSLESLVSCRGPLPVCTVLRYVLQLCDVVGYLHSAGTEPILHLDLQPKNILVCHETIKLVDFDQANWLTKANQVGRRFGTVGFAAPEQYDCTKKLDERTDIYAIGGLIFYLVTGTYPDGACLAARSGQKMWSREVGRIVAACLEPNQEERYQSVNQLKQDLEQLTEGSASSLIVAVYGNEPCIGTTHISLALSACLWQQGIPNLYEECHISTDIRSLQESRGVGMDAFGSFSVFGCVLKPYYGRQVRFLQHHYPVVIQDRGLWKDNGRLDGTEWAPAALVLLVTGGKWWSRPADTKFLQSAGNRMVIYNFSDSRIRLKPPGGTRQNMPGSYRAPLFSNPFRPEPKAERWLEALWAEAERMMHAEAVCAEGSGRSTAGMLRRTGRRVRQAVRRLAVWRNGR